MIIQEILFDLHDDPTTGMEWRMIGRMDDGSRCLLARSKKNFKHNYEAEEEISHIVKLILFQPNIDILEHPVTISKEKYVNTDSNRITAFSGEKVHRIAGTKEVPERKDING